MARSPEGMEFKAGSRRLFQLTLVALGAFAIPAAVATSAQAQHIYWAATGGGVIERANLDGSGMTTVGAGVEPCGVAVDGAHVYWANRLISSIGRANLDGTSNQLNFIQLNPGSNPCGVAVDGSHIYWANKGVSD